MPIVREHRASDCDLVQMIGRVRHEQDGHSRDVTVPDGTWDFVFRMRRGSLQIFQTGLITRPVVLDNEAGDSYFAITFKPGVFMPQRPGVVMRDTALLCPLGWKRCFWIGNTRFEVPTFDNADVFVAHLRRRGLLAQDRVVREVLESHASKSRRNIRTVQRHFVHATGLTAKSLRQIFRANKAVDLLTCGVSPAQIAVQLGYTDQSHLTSSLRRFMGRTPGEIMRDSLGCL